MEHKMKSVLDNVIYLDIETTGIDEDNSEIIEIGAVKVKDSEVSTYSTLIRPKGRVPHNIYELCNGLTEEQLSNADVLENIKPSLIEFLEKLPLICHNANFEKRFLNKYIPELKNEILDSMEFAAILEPWRREYNLESLFNEITNIKKEESHRGLEDSIDTMMVINSLLCRQWIRDEENKRKKPLYNILLRDYGLGTRWCWTKYLERPIMFNLEGFEYVAYEENKNVMPKLKPMRINYRKYEDLLKDIEIWDNGGDFGYQYREEQRAFAEKIRNNIERDEKIFIEAPTGSGKTFAYVLICALKAYLNIGSHKVEDSSFIISTDTKELQSQLISRDIPNILLKLGLNDKLKYGAIKGKSNYICTERLIKYQGFTGDINKILAEIFLKRLCKDGEYGDVENISYWAYIHFSLGDYLDDIVCDNEECNFEKCYKPCYLKKRYNELSSENITVVNHSLLASWPYSEKKKISHLIIDEAHNLMDKCYDFFSEEFISRDFDDLLNLCYETEPTIYRQFNGLNASCGYKESIELDKIKYWVTEIRTFTGILLNKTIELKLAGGEYNFRSEFFLPADDIKYKVQTLGPYVSSVKERIYGLYSLFNKWFNNITEEGEEGKDDHEFLAIYNYINKLKSAFDILDKFLEDPKEKKDYAKVIEIDKDYNYFKITNIPLNIEQLVNENILKEVKSTTFLSATMRINNSFAKIKNVLGQREAKELVVPPTFKLKEKTKIFVVNDIGRYDSSNFIKNSAKFIYDTSVKLNGHILVLFTNNNRKKRVEDELHKLIMGTRIEVHTHKKSINYLKDSSRQIIILGSRGFFEGIDLPGDALTCVMIDKVPNKSIEDPLLKALTMYKNQYYTDVNYPNICIKLKQVYGRLIRSTMDYGYFCILDGGSNRSVLNKLEKDLNGPYFLYKNRNYILESINSDYRRWNVENLNVLLKDSSAKGEFNIDKFNSESIKRKLFWKVEKVNYNEFILKNINFTVKR